ncbi:hypothetical protein Barb7_03003 [Bacteroidales bacterium Barb7]|nr:hypothetical protein Barb7_03003 [Bacteroidales bacterium Barb7]
MSFDFFLAGNQLCHFRLDGRKITFFNGNVFARIHIVVETALNSRPDAELNARIKLLQGFRHQVRTGMPVSMFALFIVPLKQFHGSIPKYGTAQILRFPVHPGG